MIASTCVENTGTIYGMQLEQVRFWTSKVGEENLKTQSDYMKEEGPQQGSAAWLYLHHECIHRRGTLTAPIGPHGEIWYS